MVSFKDPNAFADSEDSAIVAAAKRNVEPPMEYNYTEVRFVFNLRHRTLQESS